MVCLLFDDTVGNSVIQSSNASTWLSCVTTDENMTACIPRCIYVKNTYSITSETLSSDFLKNTFLQSNKIQTGKAGLSDPVIVDSTLKKMENPVPCCHFSQVNS